SRSQQITSADPNMMNVAIGKSVTATMGTSWDEDGIVRTAVEHIVDGSATSYWLSSYDNMTYEVVVDLADQHEISSAKFKFIDDAKSNYPGSLSLYSSKDGVKYDLLRSFGNVGVAETEYKFFVPNVARFYKISFLPRNSYGVKVAEFELYGKALSTGIESMEQANVTVYPNPVANGQMLNVKADENAKSVTIYTMAGVAVKHVAINSELTTISVNDLTKGIYVVKVDGAKPYVTKLVVK
ncbi:MAG: T9SS type A sorting domain-containing protein, partial [Bacteroidales bacterium]